MNVLSQSAVARLWGANEQTVALVNGTLGGISSAIGCVVGGELCARFSPKIVYVAVAVAMAGVSLVMAFSPRTELVYSTFVLVYQFVVGLSYSSFTGLVLETIGKGSAATKYNAFASLSNLRITYMGLVLAWAQAHFGERGMLFIDAGAGLVGLLALGIIAWVIGRLRLVRQGCRVCGQELAGLANGNVCPRCEPASPAS